MQGAFIALSALSLTAGNLRAVVIVPGVNNSTAPTGASNWDHVGWVVGAGSGTYLGDRWVLTAAHVEGGNVNDPARIGNLPVFNLPGRGSYTATFGSAVRLGAADLTLFRLDTDPGLSSLIFGASPLLSSSITIAGFGFANVATKTAWALTGSTDPRYATWTPSGGSWGDMSGYFYDSSTNPNTNPVRRWGRNTTTDADLVSSNGHQATKFLQSQYGNTWLFTTVFDSSLPGEGQSVEYDSGGGVFQNNRLVGITLYAWWWKNTATLGQPAYTIAFGNASSYADLFSYVDDIARITKMPPGILGDANLDGVVDKVDFKAVLTNLGTGSKWTQGDFNLDGIVDIRDLQISELRYGSTAPIAADVPEWPIPIPEPSTLALVGLAVIMLGRRR